MKRPLKEVKGKGEIVIAVRVPISSVADIVMARQKGRELALKLGFVSVEVTVIAAAISEIARNIVDYAQQGEMAMGTTRRGRHQGMVIIARDAGPGIPNVAQAMQYGYSTRQALGSGLPGAKWLMDEFDIASKPRKGTTVVMKKWLP